MARKNLATILRYLIFLPTATLTTTCASPASWSAWAHWASRSIKPHWSASSWLRPWSMANSPTSRRAYSTTLCLPCSTNRAAGISSSLLFWTTMATSLSGAQRNFSGGGPKKLRKKSPGDANGGMLDNCSCFWFFGREAHILTFLGVIKLVYLVVEVFSWIFAEITEDHITFVILCRFHFLTVSVFLQDFYELQVLYSEESHFCN